MNKSEISKKILKYLVIGGGLFIILSSPAGTRRLLKQLPKEFKKYKKRRLYRALSRLKTQNKITYVKEDNNFLTIKITENGKNYLKKVDFDYLTLKKPAVWDKNWRLVIFDIPENKKVAREALRGKLKDLELVKLQDSVWVTPFPCEREIDLIKTIFNLSDSWLDVIITNNIGHNEYYFRKTFDLL